MLAAVARPGVSTGRGEVGPAPDVAPAYPVPADEPERQRALDEIGLLDTLPESAWDDLVLLASQICGTPIAAISLVDRDRQWFKARRGIDATEMPRDLSFCAHAIAAADPVFVVEDARADPRFSGNPLVCESPSIRFYAGAVIRTPDGAALGTVCVSDARARRLDAGADAALQALARQAGMLIQMRLIARRAEQQATELRDLNEKSRAERRRSAETLEMVLRGARLGQWDLHVPSGRFSANARAAEMIGLSADAVAAGLDWRTLVHPDDWPVIGAAIEGHLRGETDHYACEHRMRHADGHWIWVLDNAVVVDRDAAGRPERIVGTHMDISSRVANRLTLQRVTHLLRRTGAMARVGGWEFDIASGKIGWTDEVYRIHEVDASLDPSLVDALAFYPQPGRAVLEAAVARAVEHGEAYELELPFVTARGRQLHVRAHGEAERVDGVTVRLSGTFQDITAQKAAEQAAIQSERRLRLIADNMPALISYVDSEQRYRFVNANTKSVLGTSVDDAIGCTIREVRGDAVYDDLRPHVEAALRGEKISFSYDLQVHGRTLRLQANFIPDIDAGGAVRGFYAMTVDVSEQHATERRLEELARLDVLTGLPNRRLFDERIAEALLRARASGRPLALMFLDLDRFKSINDTLGHAGGDAVLREFGRRLQRCMRDTDTVARVAGDEFVVVCEGAGALPGTIAEALGQKVLDSMRVPFALAGGPLRVTTSIGIALGRLDETDPAKLLARADRALYEAKRSGRDGWALDLGD